MGDWDFSPPRSAELGDHDVPLLGEQLVGRRIALLVTGGIAAMKAPLVARALRRRGAEVTAFVSREGLRYVTEETLAWSTVRPVVTRLTPAAEHLSDGQPFDAYLLAPATYNSLNKIAGGTADSVVTSTLASAIGRLERGETQVLVAPTMHGTLHTRILTDSLRRLADLGVRVIPPRDDYGKHNLPSEEVLVAEVCRAVSRSPLAGVSLLVTGGPTAVVIDAIRRLTNKFTGELGCRIAEELYLRGAEVHWVHGESPFSPPEYLPCRPVRNFDDYRHQVLEVLGEKACPFAVFSAAVADYRPITVLPGKTPSGGALQSLELEPTEKVVETVRQRFPDLHMVTFKYQEDISHQELLEIAAARRARGYQAVVANRGEERGPNGEQVAYLTTEGAEPQRLVDKRGIARALADYLEQQAGADSG
ncbi:MAG: phosphopantothenoylcysteine decarboxylase [Acidobacteriota bacterium]